MKTGTPTTTDSNKNSQPMLLAPQLRYWKLERISLRAVYSINAFSLGTYILCFPIGNLSNALTLLLQVSTRRVAATPWLFSRSHRGNSCAVCLESERPRPTKWQSESYSKINPTPREKTSPNLAHKAIAVPTTSADADDHLVVDLPAQEAIARHRAIPTVPVHPRLR
jgi:hypothetical protein